MVTTNNLVRLSARVYSQYNEGGVFELDIRGFTRLEEDIGRAENPPNGFLRKRILVRNPQKL